MPMPGVLDCPSLAGLPVGGRLAECTDLGSGRVGRDLSGADHRRVGFSPRIGAGISSVGCGGVWRRVRPHSARCGRWILSWTPIRDGTAPASG